MNAPQVFKIDGEEYVDGAVKERDGKFFRISIAPVDECIPPIHPSLKDVREIRETEIEQTEVICFECGEHVYSDERYVTVELVDNPWGEAVKRTVHIDNDDQYGRDCHEKLFDTSWADFRYLDCPVCGRNVIRQCPSNGWNSYVRELGEEEVCISCWEKHIFENGTDREDLEANKLPGYFFDPAELRNHGYEEVPEFQDVRINGKESAREFCQAALELMDTGCKVVVEYERMAIGGSEGYVSLWKKEKEG